MIAQNGSRESQMTPEELVREAEERGDDLALALASLVDEYPTGAEREKEEENNRVQSEYEGARGLWEKIEDGLLAVKALLDTATDEDLINMGMSDGEVSDLRRDFAEALKAEPVDPSAPPVKKAA